jgi:hypothetical protein
VEVVLHGGGAASESVAGLSLLGSAVAAITSSSTPWTQAVERYDATVPTEFGYARIPLPGAGVLTRYIRLEMSEPIDPKLKNIEISEVLLYEPFNADGLSIDIHSLTRSTTALRTDVTPLQTELSEVQGQLAEVQTDIAALQGTVPGLVPFTGANVVSSTPGTGTDREANNLFDKPGDPFLVGGTGEFVYTVNVALVPGGVVEMVLDLNEAVKLTDFSFYSNNNLGRLPRDYVILSGDSGTGPWTSRATKNLPGATPSGAVTVSVPVDFTARYCRVTFSNMHSIENYLQLSECKVSGMLSPAMRLTALEMRIAALEGP